ncbi:prokaryotic diacylglycerol kinase family protein [Vibrio parahaemolyticus 10290]|nr:prokaryotic diacylglycerol kinase family protein [Vibrio parahaemolyticus 10290]
MSADDWHELSGRAKDIGSAAVFVALFLALLFGRRSCFSFIQKVTYEDC